MATIEQNLEFWGKDYQWTRDGDEWDDQAKNCGVPYSEWKVALVNCFIRPNLERSATALEIAPGHGRWTVVLSSLVEDGRCIAVDVSPSCIESCKANLPTLNNVEYHVNDGRSLAMVASDTVDFVWSFDSFVHMDHDVIEGYLAEIARVLKPGHRGVIHHAGHPETDQRRAGWRSKVTDSEFRDLLQKSGLTVLAQTDSWGTDNRCNTKLFGDYITTFEKAAAP